MEPERGNITTFNTTVYVTDEITAAARRFGPADQPPEPEAFERQPGPHPKAHAGPKPVARRKRPALSAGGAACAADATGTDDASAGAVGAGAAADETPRWRFWARWCGRRQTPAVTRLAVSPLAVTHLAPPAAPDCPELGFVILDDARFYVVWRTHDDEGLPPSQVTGIWCGSGADVWWELQQHLPRGEYTGERCHLKRYHSWAEAWQAWWTRGPLPRPREPPHVYHMVAAGGDAGRPE